MQALPDDNEADTISLGSKARVQEADKVSDLNILVLLIEDERIPDHVSTSVVEEGRQTGHQQASPAGTPFPMNNGTEQATLPLNDRRASDFDHMLKG